MQVQLEHGITSQKLSNRHPAPNTHSWSSYVKFASPYDALEESVIEKVEFYLCEGFPDPHR
eukprot:Awhi_evm1s11596